MTIAVPAAPAQTRFKTCDKLGVLIGLIAIAGLCLPFMLVRANRIVPGEPRALSAALPGVEGTVLLLMLIAAIVSTVLKLHPTIKLALSLVLLITLFLLVGRSANFLTPQGNSYARVSAGAGFWVLVFAFALLAADALTRLRLRAWPRLAILALVALAFALLFGSGSLNNISTLKEYLTRAEAFWREAQTHVLLAFGAVLIATAVGVPVGILCFRVAPLRAGVLNLLNIVQTVPSIALFGLLIAPLAWVAGHVPGARDIGISGIGVAPALVALFAYSLLPVVSNTVVGLSSVPDAANDAAEGMGMTRLQRLFAVELPLAFPVILTGIRIVLVQNIGLATIAALIGGGGFGVFVFQGIGQTAMDLVLLGAVPTVALAFAAAVVLDALVEMAGRGRRI